MKKISLYSLLIGTSLIFANCKTTPPAPNPEAEEVNIPFSDAKYRSDAETFRKTASGNSPDLQYAKELAALNAKAGLTADLSAMIQRVFAQYKNQRNIKDVAEFEAKSEQRTIESVAELIANVKDIDEKVYKEKNGTFTYWIAIEVKKEEALNKLSKKISNDDKLKLDYDEIKFREIFDQEMEKLKNSR